MSSNHPLLEGPPRPGSEFSSIASLSQQQDTAVTSQPLLGPLITSACESSYADQSSNTLLPVQSPGTIKTGRVTAGRFVRPSNAASETFGSQCSTLSQQSSMAGVKVSYDLTPFSSTQSSLFPLCRICQLPHDNDNILITPCKCNGTLKHVHGTCLRKWMELRSRRKRTEYPDRCELCGYLYRKHKYLKCTDCRWPKMKLRDKVLHSIFLLSLIIMLSCAIITIQCLISDSAQNGANKFRIDADLYLDWLLFRMCLLVSVRYGLKPNDMKPSLSYAELTTLICGILFFVTFIIAMLVEIKAKHTIYNMFRRFLRQADILYIRSSQLQNTYTAAGWC